MANGDPHEVVWLLLAFAAGGIGFGWVFVSAIRRAAPPEELFVRLRAS